MAIFLVLALIGWVVAPAEAGVSSFFWMLMRQGVIGVAVGVAGGLAIAALLNRLPLAQEQAGLSGLLVLSSGLAVFAGTGWAEGSGFLAVYLFGLLVAHRSPQVVERALAAMDGFAWLAQAGMFLLLGLLVTPSRLLPNLGTALGVALVLMFVARPLAVALCLKPLGFPRCEIGFVSWVGLARGGADRAGVFPLMAGVPQARVMFDIAFVVVLVSLLLQGATMTRAARLFRVNLPDVDDEPGRREVYGDFVLDPLVPVGELFDFYGLEAPTAESGRSLADWLEARIGRPPVIGDSVRWGAARVAVRAMDHGRITQVGLKLDAEG